MAALIDTIISSVTRYVLFSGLITHVYDSRKHLLVHSRWAHCYSFLLHLTLILLLFVVYQQAPTDQRYTQTDSHFFESFYMLNMGVGFLAFLACIASQWTLRSNCTTHFNEILEIWNKDMPYLQSSREINRQTARLFLAKTISSGLLLLNGIVGTYHQISSSNPALQAVYILLIFNVVLALMTLFSSGLVFSVYIFRLLNFNLVRIVQEVRDIRYTRAPGHDFRKKSTQLETELGAIQRIHAQLLRWVVRFKNLYQIEVMLCLMSFFVLQVGTFFILFVMVYEQWVLLLLHHFVAVSASFTVFALDNVVMFYVYGELLKACNSTEDILKDLPAGRLLRTQLEKSVEMLCLQLKCEKLRLRICGLVDLDWRNIFTMTEETFLYIILLIQMDFENL